ncbi:MAG: hypothetical protein MUF39_09400 [Cyclobacteriaceae bacterium]|jgi:hypothetical protein|nr:hypothetical protein [Cyclobacteriaceae bacterium]
MIKSLLVFVSAALLLIGCNRSNLKYEKPYIDFDSLVNQQVSLLLNEKISIQKHAELNGKIDDTTFTPDSLHLANELEIFRQLDVINKPIHRTSYTITDGEKDIKSNLLIYSYTFNPKGPQDRSAVSFIRFYYMSSPLNPKRIEAVYREENTLYVTERKLFMEFDDITGKNLLSKYKMEGMQKLILNDSTHFFIESTLTPAGK